MLVDRFIHFRCLASRTLTGLPCSQGTPRACAVLSDPGRTSAPRHNGTPVLPPPLGQRRLQPHLYFEAPSHGFGTGCLRFVPPLLTTTQNSLPGVANLFRVGLDTHGVPLESFGPSGPPLSLGFPWRDQAPRHTSETLTQRQQRRRHSPQRGSLRSDQQTRVVRKWPLVSLHGCCALHPNAQVTDRRGELGWTTAAAPPSER